MSIAWIVTPSPVPVILSEAKDLPVILGPQAEEPAVERSEGISRSS